MKSQASRLPYLLAGFAVVAVVVMAWVRRDRITPVGPGASAPAFQAHDLSKEPAGLDDYEGKVVLLNIWATWCPPCRQEMPSLERLYESYQGKDFQIVAVSVDAREGQKDAFGRPGGDLEAYADSMGLTFPILHDPSGHIQDIYRTTGVPESFLIGRDGKIYKRVTGAAEWDTKDQRQLIDRLLAQGSDRTASVAGSE